MIFKIHPKLTVIGAELIGHDDDHVRKHQTTTLYLIDISTYILYVPIQWGSRNLETVEKALW